ncbi:MAG: class I SAM-dependent methyltransferase [bacterium]|nr:class I SAM-dependent methyltransferase [bacterium]
MSNRDIKIDVGQVQETLMLPLWARAREAEKSNPIVCDTLAKNIIERIDYDFSRIEESHMAEHQGVWAIRAYNFDNIVKEFLANNSRAVVVNFGAGLETTFQRVDEGTVLWINIDLPDVAALRQKLIPDSERETTIAKSILDLTWTDDISRLTQGRPTMFMAAGVLCYFDAREIEILFRKLAATYPSSHVVFDSMSWLPAWGSNREIKRCMESGEADSSTLIKWHLKRASGLRKWVDSIRTVEEYPMLSRVPARNDFNKRETLQIRIVGLFRFYNMIHVQL